MDIDTNSNAPIQMGYRQQHDYWESRSMQGQTQSGMVAASPNPNDEDSIPTVIVHGRGPGRRAGHTATAVNRKIFVFGGSCGSDYCECLSLSLFLYLACSDNRAQKLSFFFVI